MVAHAGPMDVPAPLAWRARRARPAWPFRPGWPGWPFCLLALLCAGPPAQARSPLPPAVAVVAGLYREIAWQAVIEAPADTGPGLLEQPLAGLQRHFDPELARLILADRACAARRQGVCALDFDPLWDSQDPQGATVAITPAGRPGQVQVAVHYPGARARPPMTFVLVSTPAGWRIADIRFGNGRPSLKSLLQAPAPR